MACFSNFGEKFAKQMFLPKWVTMKLGVYEAASMNIYDFDETIYDGDSSLDFFLYVLCKKPYLIVLIPFQLWGMAKYFLGIAEKETYKEHFFVFLRFIPVQEMVFGFWNQNRRKIKPWYLLRKQNSDIIISASPQFLLEPIVIDYFGVTLIASKLDPDTGRYIGKNCLGEEKVSRLHNIYPDCIIENFFSDSLSDAPLAGKAQQSFMVKGTNIIPWPETSKNPQFHRYPLKHAQRHVSVRLVGNREAMFLLIWVVLRKYSFRNTKLRFSQKRKASNLEVFRGSQMTFFEKIKKTYFSKEFIVFVFCGGIGTLTNFIFSLIISIMLDPSVSYVFGYGISLFITYSLNAKLIFHQKISKTAFIKFVISYIPNFIILFTFVLVFLNLLGWNKVIVYALASMLGLPITFILVKLTVFNKRAP